MADRIYLGAILGADGHYYTARMRLSNSAVFDRIYPAITERANAVPYSMTEDEDYYFVALNYKNAAVTLPLLYKIPKTHVEIIPAMEAYNWDSAETRFLLNDTDAIYAYHQLKSTKIVVKYDKSTMAKLQEVEVGTYTQAAAAVDESALYTVSGSSSANPIVNKFDKDTLSEVASSGQFYAGRSQDTLVELGDYLYSATTDSSKVKKIDKSTLTVVGESVALDGADYVISEGKDGFLYATNGAKAYKLDPSTLSVVAEGPIYTPILTPPKMSVADRIYLLFSDKSGIAIIDKATLATSDAIIYPAQLETIDFFTVNANGSRIGLSSGNKLETAFLEELYEIAGYRRIE